MHGHGWLFAATPPEDLRLGPSSISLAFSAKYEAFSARKRAVSWTLIAAETAGSTLHMTCGANICFQVRSRQVARIVSSGRQEDNDPNPTPPVTSKLVSQVIDTASGNQWLVADDNADTCCACT